MNEGIFANYDSIFCSSALSSDFAESQDVQAGANYLNELSLQQTRTNVIGRSEQHMQQMSFSHQHHQQQHQQPTMNTMAVAGPASITNNNTAMGAGPTALAAPFASIPFVQIHTTDVQPQRSHGKVYRRSVTSNHEEIKSEPIKSENSDAAKERMNATPTPPVRTASGNGNSNGRVVTPENTSFAPAVDEVMADAVETTTTGTHELPVVHKCHQCPFISLSKARMTTHLSSEHVDHLFGRQDVFSVSTKCPGCDNLFYTHNSITTHLLEDHLMLADDVEVVLKALKRGCQSRLKTTNSNFVDTAEMANEGAGKDTHRKSRIYLKNVECLREPRREPNEQHDNHITDSFDFADAGGSSNGIEGTDFIGTISNERTEHSVCGPSNDLQLHRPPKQKISIKSVDVLREPALLRRDYELQNYNNFMSACSELDATINENMGHENDISCNGEGGLNLGVQDKPRRPKIYIKNVDILKEPMTIPNNLNASTLTLTEANSNMNFNFMPPALPPTASNYDDNLSSSGSQMFDSTLATLPLGTISEQYLFENSNNNFLSGVCETENFPFLSTSNSGSFLLDGVGRYSNIDCVLETSPAPEASEPTPSPPPPTPALPLSLNQSLLTPPATLVQQPQIQPLQQQKQKIFIKNVDILKEPQFQEQRGTLHLRTVDELNLMNKNEVQNLIAPNLDNMQMNCIVGEDDLNEHFSSNSTDNSKIPEDVEKALFAVETGSFKLHDFDANVVNSWTDDYDLGDGIDCIITDSITPLNIDLTTSAHSVQRIFHDLDTPQVSLISIRDIEELTGSTPQSTGLNSAPEHREVVPSDADAQSALDECASVPDCNIDEEATFDKAQGDEQKTEANCCEQERPTLGAATTEIENDTVAQKAVNFNDVPPLAPVTSVASASATDAPTTNSRDIDINIPLPPLVPVSTQNFSICKPNPGPVQMPGALASSTNTEVTTVERGRIYVANNLLQSTKRGGESTARNPVAVSITGGTSVRGRPFGSKRTGITKMRKIHGSGVEREIGIKCSLLGCAFRFKKPETLEYHKRCHSSNSETPQVMLCPECRSTDFANWNTLHTHLWRTHKIDMELYSCGLCDFKTPVYSRLLNTHSKIHSEDRNYKCEQCEKAFKNTKQLKNHRRWHRNHAAGSTGDDKDKQDSPLTPVALHRCSGCQAVFSHQKSLRGHRCKNGSDTAEVQCDICGHVASSKSSLKLHLLTHDEAKRFKCSACAYTANDHNAFRRHKMTHANNKMYVCPACNYKSVQSVAYQKHVQLKHPHLAETIIHKCSLCSYSTINRALYTVHQAKHEVPLSCNQHSNESCIPKENNPTSMQRTDASTSVHLSSNNLNIIAATQDSPFKIKIKSNLLPTFQQIS